MNRSPLPRNLSFVPIAERRQDVIPFFHSTSMKLTIPRFKWLRGEGFQNSRLLRPSDDKMCCLGHFAVSCGVPVPQLSNLNTPPQIGKTLWTKLRRGGAWLFSSGGIASLDYPSQDCTKLMRINDDPKMSDQARERELKKIFAQHGVEVKFVNKETK